MRGPMVMTTALLVAAALVVIGCGASSGGRRPATSALGGSSTPTTLVPKAHPQAVEPTAGQQAQSVTPDAPPTSDPVGDVNAHAPSIAQVKAELKQALIAAPVTNAPYINPLRFVTVWGRTDQGIDASMPVGAPILAPCPVKILAIIPDWYAGQPLVYFELLNGPDAGKIQYVAEQITNIAPPGSILRQGQPIAVYAPSGTSIEYGWSTINGVTLARATTGYEEGQVTPAGVSIRAWLNALGANAGPG
jgi:hypothetical protein